MSENVSYLLPYLRLKLGDTDPTAYRYLDTWLTLALVASISALSNWWGSKYIVDDTGTVTRNPANSFSVDESEGTIQKSDEWPIIIMAGIVVKEGSLENNAWDIGSWRDSEISYSNIQSGVLKDSSLKRDWQELLYYVKPPMRHLMGAKKSRIAREYIGGW
jgi:hypothetical protein